MSVTHSYSAAHRTFAEVAAENGFTAHDLRVLVALVERNGSSCTDVIGTDLCLGESASTRRSISRLRKASLVRGGDKTGLRTKINLTSEGIALGKAYMDRYREVRSQLYEGRVSNGTV